MSEIPPHIQSKMRMNQLRSLIKRNTKLSPEARVTYAAEIDELKKIAKAMNTHKPVDNRKVCGTCGSNQLNIITGGCFDCGTTNWVHTSN